jgi:hypothetical protein
MRGSRRRSIRRRGLHGVDGTTYDAVYFRPFNFKSDDPARLNLVR